MMPTHHAVHMWTHRGSGGILDTLALAKQYKPYYILLISIDYPKPLNPRSPKHPKLLNPDLL